MRRVRTLAIWAAMAAMALLIGAGAQAAHAEGETVDIVSLSCERITIRGGGYTPGQDLLLFARAPQGEGTITDQKTVQANADGMAPTTDLTFGGQVPDGTYLAIITTPGPGQKEEVAKRFEMKGCGPGGTGQALPFTGSHSGLLAVVGLGLVGLGALALRRARA
jgi:hypothetical protein